MEWNVAILARGGMRTGTILDFEEEEEEEEENPCVGAIVIFECIQ
jgi:hypothetical protein